MVLGWWILYYFIALAISLVIWFVYKISHRGLVVYALTLFAIFWLLLGGGCNTIGGYLAEQMGDIRPSQQAKPKDVPGTRAPRVEKPTIVKGNGDDGAFEVSIDGSNEYGLLDPAPGHRTGIKVNPGKSAVITHINGRPAINTFGAKFPICGKTWQKGSHPYRRFRFEEGWVHAYGIGGGLADAKHQFKFLPFPCDDRQRRIVLRNETKEDRWVILFFNTAEHYRDEDNMYKRDGYAYAGWDGERALFLVELP